MGKKRKQEALPAMSTAMSMWNPLFNAMPASCWQQALPPPPPAGHAAEEEEEESSDSEDERSRYDKGREARICNSSINIWKLPFVRLQSIIEMVHEDFDSQFPNKRLNDRLAHAAFLWEAWFPNQGVRKVS